MHSVANLATLQTPLATFFSSKKCPNLKFLKLAGTAARMRGLAFPARAHLSLSLCVHLLSSVSGGEEQCFQLNTDIILLL